MSDSSQENNGDRNPNFLRNTYIEATAFEMKEEGTINIQAEFSLRISVYWMEIAIDHVERAQKARSRAHKQVKEGDGAPFDELEAEFKSGMQSIFAAATAVDAFYARVKKLAPLSHPPKRKTARYVQVAEVLKQRLAVDHDQTKKIRSVLEEIYEYRDKAAHPPAIYGIPRKHPDLPVRVERRFVEFGYPNARAITSNALSLIEYAVSSPKEDYPDLISYFHDLRDRVSDLVNRWDDQFDSINE